MHTPRRIPQDVPSRLVASGTTTPTSTKQVPLLTLACVFLRAHSALNGTLFTKNSSARACWFIVEETSVEILKCRCGWSIVLKLCVHVTVLYWDLIMHGVFRSNPATTFADRCLNPDKSASSLGAMHGEMKKQSFLHSHEYHYSMRAA